MRGTEEQTPHEPSLALGTEGGHPSRWADVFQGCAGYRRAERTTVPDDNNQRA